MGEGYLKVGLIDTQKSYLPEIYAYHSYLNMQSQIEASIIKATDIKEYKDGDFDVIWKFPGLDFKRDFKTTKVIHEYNSLSVGSFVQLKNFLKKRGNIRPDGRVFLNQFIENELNFKDQIPSIKRDMGISKDFFIKTHKKEYDFVYLGTMDKSRNLHLALQPFVTDLKGKTIVLIGDPEEELYNEYKKYKNIIFTGRVAYKKVAEIAAKAEYGYNYIPNIYPFNVQTSTKLLEYCAMGLKIVTTSYEWVDKFELDSGGSFFRLNSNLSNLTIEELNKFPFNTPDVLTFEWNRLLSQIKLIDFINKI